MIPVWFEVVREPVRERLKVAANHVKKYYPFSKKDVIIVNHGRRQRMTCARFNMKLEG